VELTDDAERDERKKLSQVAHGILQGCLGWFFRLHHSKHLSELRFFPNGYHKALNK